MAPRHQFDKSLDDLNAKVFELGHSVTSQIEKATQSLVKKNLDLANQVVAGDTRINDIQAELESQCMLLIATQQPFAKDLRKIVAAFKISIFLERMGDLSVDIAKTTIRMGDEPLIKPLIDLPRMSEFVKEMINNGLTAYQTENLEMALDVALMDDQVDNLYKQIFNELLLFMMQDPRTINQATYLIFVGRFFERIGDYCTNISEEIQYVITGKRTDLN